MSNRDEAVYDLLIQIFLSTLRDVEGDLCGHDDTERGYYAGARAALKWLEQAEAAGLPDAAMNLHQCIDDMQGKRAQSETTTGR